MTQPLRPFALLLASLVVGCVAPAAGPGSGGDANVDAGPPPPPPEVEVLLDREVARLTNGTSTAISFTVPVGVVSLTVTVEGDERDQLYVSQWVDEEGFTLVSKDWIEASSNQSGVCVSCKNRVTLNEAVSGAIAPNAPAVEIHSGTHTIRVSGLRQVAGGATGSNGTAYVTVHAKSAPAVPEAGTLDLNLHFTGVNGWSAASAPGSSSFKRLIDGMREVYETRGITLGELRYFDVPTEFRVVESVSGPDSDLMRLFETSGDHPDDNALNLFFVEEISSDFGVILGIAGGIPGPVKLQGTPRSGVAIVGKRIAGAGGDPALTAAHEAGHYLGLFHTSEYGFGRRQMHDQLADTPEDDEDYLMHASGSGDLLSPWQGRIMRLNPWVRTQDL